MTSAPAPPGPSKSTPATTSTSSAGRRRELDRQAALEVLVDAGTMAWQGVLVAGDANRRQPGRPSIVAGSYWTFRPIAYRWRVGTGRIRIGLLLAILAAAVTQLLSALPGAAQETASPCQHSPTPGESQIALISGGVERTALLHVPPAAAGQRLPVVVGLHGAGGKFFESYSGFSVLADAEDFIAVYPNPLYKSKGNTFWDISSTLPGGGPDVQFLANLLDYLASNLCVDTSRVYAAGVSNGGGLATRAACELSSRFAAIASIAGASRPARSRRCSSAAPSTTSGSSRSSIRSASSCLPLARGGQPAACRSILR